MANTQRATRSSLDGSETKPDIRMGSVVPLTDSANTQRELAPKADLPALDPSGTKGDRMMSATARSRPAGRRGRQLRTK
jgi:hypothetical protein